MKQSIREKLENLKNRLEELNRFLASENATKNIDEYRKNSREQAELGEIVALFNKHKAAENALIEAQKLLNDPEMKELALLEIDDLNLEIEQAEQAVAPQLISMFAELDADGEDQHLQHSHRRRDRAFAHLAGEQR